MQYTQFLKNIDKTYYLNKDLNLDDKMKSECIGVVPAISPENLGSQSFKKEYGLKYAYMGGSMANEISSVEMVIAFGKSGMICSFGAGGISPKRLEESIVRIKEALPNGPYCFNLIHSPFEPEAEMNAVKLYLKHNINIVEASAYINLTPSLVYYRAMGLSKNENGEIIRNNKIIAKISRDKIAQRFMEPAAKKIVNKLLSDGLISQEQADLVMQVPMADDITVEADSGGHTDNRPLVTIFSVIRNLRDKMYEEYKNFHKIRIGVGGGISTPESMLAGFMMGADYVVTGSINQACIESGTSDYVRKLLETVEYADVTSAPCADMFELGVKVQVLKKGTQYSSRAFKLYEMYTKYNGINEIPQDEKIKIEEQFFGKTMEKVWEETVAFFTERDPSQIEKAKDDEKKKMALIFRWYLGLSPFWARKAIEERKQDYQIWCGPAMGAFNDWAKATIFEKAENRKVADVAVALMKECCYLYRLNILKAYGVEV